MSGWGREGARGKGGMGPAGVVSQLLLGGGAVCPEGQVVGLLLFRRRPFFPLVLPLLLLLLQLRWLGRVRVLQGG